MIAYRHGERAVFLLGFARSSQANVEEDELRALRRRAAALLTASVESFEGMVIDDELREVSYDDD